MNNEVNIVDSEKALKHIYIDVEADLLSKANALCDLILIAKEVPAVIFANAPSEADMIENLLNKNNVKSLKLIGHVPYMKVSDAVKKAKEGEVQAVVITDIASREMDIGSFKTLINYSIHEDPEIYLHRYAGLDANSKLEKIISLISPQDFGNFHYIKKIMDFPFEQGSLPDKSDFYRQQADEFITKAAAFEITENQKLKIFLEEIEKNAANAKILPFLLNQYFTAASRVTEAPRRERTRNNKINHQEHESEERERNYTPKEELPKFSRIYIGQGTQNGLSIEKFEKFVADNQAASELARLNIRECYGFVDVPMEQTETFLEKMQGLELDEGKKIYLKKATNITALREESSANQSVSDENSVNLESEDQDNEEATA